MRIYFGKKKEEKNPGGPQLSTYADVRLSQTCRVDGWQNGCRSTESTSGPAIRVMVMMLAVSPNTCNDRAEPGAKHGEPILFIHIQSFRRHETCSLTSPACVHVDRSPGPGSAGPGGAGCVPIVVMVSPAELSRVPSFVVSGGHDVLPTACITAAPRTSKLLNGGPSSSFEEAPAPAYAQMPRWGAGPGRKSPSPGRFAAPERGQRKIASCRFLGSTQSAWL